ncbi:hypothetical protein Tco_0356442 [Tanacetum coccineum]
MGLRSRGSISIDELLDRVFPAPKNLAESTLTTERIAVFDVGSRRGVSSIVTVNTKKSITLCSGNYHMDNAIGYLVDVKAIVVNVVVRIPKDIWAIKRIETHILLRDRQRADPVMFLLEDQSANQLFCLRIELHRKGTLEMVCLYIPDNPAFVKSVQVALAHKNSGAQEKINIVLAASTKSPISSFHDSILLRCSDRRRLVRNANTIKVFFKDLIFEFCFGALSVFSYDDDLGNSKKDSNSQLQEDDIVSYSDEEAVLKFLGVLQFMLSDLAFCRDRQQSDSEINILSWDDIEVVKQ